MSAAAVHRPVIEQAASAHRLDPDLVEALVLQESGGNQGAWNPEPKYRYFWNVRTHAPFRAVSAAEVAAEYPPKDFPALAGDRDQEWWAQQASWGLMQLMGAVAREHGYAEPYLTWLVIDPSVNLAIGCAHLAALMRWARGLYTGLASREQAAVTRSALAAYNGGKAGNGPMDVALRNAAYADTVTARYLEIRRGR